MVIPQNIILVQKNVTETDQGKVLLFGLRKNARHLKRFCIQIRDVAHDENKYGFDNQNTVGVLGDKTGQETPKDANSCSTQSHN